MQCRWLRDQFGHSWSVNLHLVNAQLTVKRDDTDDNKTKIAKSGALVPLTRLARSKDMRVQRNATGALLNMTHSGSSRACVRLRLFIYFHRRKSTATCRRWSDSCACEPSELTRYRRAILLYNGFEQYCC
jgi:hypothetical protein